MPPYTGAANRTAGDTLNLFERGSARRYESDGDDAAGWTVAWRRLDVCDLGLHGLFLVINHAWHALRRFFGQDPNAPLSPFMHAFSVLLTFLAVTVSWVFFRADSSHNAMVIIKAMCVMNGFDLPAAWLVKWGRIGSQLADMGFGTASTLVSAGTINWIVILLVLVWAAPNTQQILMRYEPALDVPRNTPATRLAWQPGYRWLALHVGTAIWAITAISQLSPFLYFQF